MYCVDVSGVGVGDEETALSNINNTARPAASSLDFYLHEHAVFVQGHSLTLLIPFISMLTPFLLGVFR